MSASEDDKDVLSFSCIDADARDEIERRNARRARFFGADAILIYGSALAFAVVVHAIWGGYAGIALGILVVVPIVRRMLRPFTRPLIGNTEAEFTIAISDTGLEASFRGRAPTRVPLERIVELVADDRLRISLDDGTLVTLPCVVASDRLAALAGELNATLRRRRARVADYRGARIAAEPDEIAEIEDAAARRDVS